MQAARSYGELLFYFLAVILMLLALILASAAPHFVYNIPRMDSGDALFSSAIVKTIMDTGWYLHNHFLGAPGYFSLIDYPLVEGGNFAIIKFLAFFSNQYGVVLNNFYYLTFFLIFFSSLYTLRVFQLNRFFAMGAALLFTFLPYHLWRAEGHLFLSNYAAVPFYILVANWIFSNKPINLSQCLIWTSILLIAASTDIYLSHLKMRNLLQ